MREADERDGDDGEQPHLVRRSATSRRLRNQQHFAGCLPALERAVRLGGVLERESNSVRSLSLPAAIQPNSRSRAAAAPRASRCSSRAWVVSERATFLAEQLRIERRDRPARLPEQHQHAARHEAVQALQERRLADRS